MKYKTFKVITLLSAISLFATGCGANLLNYIKGEQGVPGEKGETGANGKPGIDGKDGIDGINGQDGTSVFTGGGVPSSELGKIGDSYIDLSTWDYFVKDEDGWHKKGNIKVITIKDNEGKRHSTSLDKFLKEIRKHCEKA